MLDARFEGSTVLITGGGSGIGRATALAFAQAGAQVVVCGRRPGPLEETVSMASDAAGSIHPTIADIAIGADMERLVTSIVSTHGSLDVAVNSAGMVEDGAVADLSEQQWDRVLRTNLTGTWQSMKYEIRHMREHAGGAIVNISSIVGCGLTIPGRGLYGATKAAINSLTRTAAIENIGAGVRINCVLPAAVDTPMSFEPGETVRDRDARLNPQSPIGRVGRVDEVADAVLWLAGDRSSFAVGHELVLDGGVTV